MQSSKKLNSGTHNAWQKPITVSQQQSPKSMTSNEAPKQKGLKGSELFSPDAALTEGTGQSSACVSNTNKPEPSKHNAWQKNPLDVKPKNQQNINKRNNGNSNTAKETTKENKNSFNQISNSFQQELLGKKPVAREEKTTSTTILHSNTSISSNAVSCKIENNAIKIQLAGKISILSANQWPNFICQLKNTNHLSEITYQMANGEQATIKHDLKTGFSDYSSPSQNERLEMQYFGDIWHKETDNGEEILWHYNPLTATFSTAKCTNTDNFIENFIGYDSEKEYIRLLEQAIKIITAEKKISTSSTKKISTSSTEEISTFSTEEIQTSSTEEIQTSSTEEIPIFSTFYLGSQQEYIVQENGVWFYKNIQYNVLQELKILEKNKKNWQYAQFKEQRGNNFVYKTIYFSPIFSSKVSGELSGEVYICESNSHDKPGLVTIIRGHMLINLTGKNDINDIIKCTQDGLETYLVKKYYYEGIIYNCTISGPGQYRYEGQINRYLIPHGKGKLTHDNGDVYEGEFYHGLYHGRGILHLNLKTTDTYGEWDYFYSWREAKQEKLSGIWIFGNFFTISEIKLENVKHILQEAREKLCKNDEESDSSKKNKHKTQSPNEVAVYGKNKHKTQASNEVAVYGKNKYTIPDPNKMGTIVKTGKYLPLLRLIGLRTAPPIFPYLLSFSEVILKIWNSPPAIKEVCLKNTNIRNDAFISAWKSESSQANNSRTNNEKSSSNVTSLDFNNQVETTSASSLKSAIIPEDSVQSNENEFSTKTVISASQLDALARVMSSKEGKRGILEEHLKKFYEVICLFFSLGAPTNRYFNCATSNSKSTKNNQA